MFLWGVFRAKKQAAKLVSLPSFVAKEVPGTEALQSLPGSVSRAPAMCDTALKVKHSNSGVENTGEIDMEVDMEGGKECGVSDKAVKRHDTTNPPLTPPLSPTGGNTRTPIALSKATDSTLQSLVLNTDVDKAKEDLDLPPGFAPTLTLPPTAVALEEPSSGSTLPPGFGKTEARKQVTHSFRFFSLD